MEAANRPLSGAFESAAAALPAAHRDRTVHVAFGSFEGDTTARCTVSRERVETGQILYPPRIGRLPRFFLWTLEAVLEKSFFDFLRFILRRLMETPLRGLGGGRASRDLAPVGSRPRTSRTTPTI